MSSTAELLDRGMQCLIRDLGSVDAERFFSTVLRERFDYTKWQRDYFDAMPSGEFHNRAVEYARTHPSW